MKRKIVGFILIMLFCWLSENSFAQDTIYIDPANSSDPSMDGSIEHPFDNWGSLDKEDNTVYLIQRGSVIEESGKFEINNLNNITVGAYGSGNKPRITTSSVLVQSCESLVIRDIEIYSDGGVCLEFNHHNPSKDVLIENCVIHSPPTWEENAYNYGISAGVNGLKIYDTEVYNIYRDGLYFDHANNIDIKGCYIHDVNQHFLDAPEDAGGDGIQFVGCDSILLRETVIDRSGTGKKFCVIVQNADDTENITNVVFEDNHFIGPDITEYGGAGLFTGVEGITIRRNIIEGSPSGVYTHAHEILINNNLFLNNGTGISVASNWAEIYHNVFYGNGLAVHSSNRPSILKNNIVYLTDSADEGFNDVDCEVSHNLQNISSVTSPWFDANIIADPLFVDADNFDFHLQENSSCIDAGTEVGIIYDYDLQTIPCNGIPDIGAFEYQGNCDPSDNRRPVADAGDDQIVNSEDFVELDGSNSYDPDEDSLYFSWVSPEEIELSDNTAVMPTFYAPEVSEDTDFMFTLTLNDGELSSKKDTAIITVLQQSTGVNTFEEDFYNFKVYPNPTADHLVLYPNKSFDVKGIIIKIYSLDGKLLKTQHHSGYIAEGGAVNLNITGLTASVYIITVEDNGKLLYQSKFIKD
ncbi:MAG: right-handed parallel beta-helix repeat-containing protein [Bacteroidales bacterium]